MTSMQNARPAIKRLQKNRAPVSRMSKGSVAIRPLRKRSEAITSVTPAGFGARNNWSPAQYKLQYFRDVQLPKCSFHASNNVSLSITNDSTFLKSLPENLVKYRHLESVYRLFKFSRHHKRATNITHAKTGCTCHRGYNLARQVHR